jgi:uncharacterized ion transporter superfamily protein YfcC
MGKRTSMMNQKEIDKRIAFLQEVIRDTTGSYSKYVGFELNKLLNYSIFATVFLLGLLSFVLYRDAPYMCPVLIGISLIVLYLDRIKEVSKHGIVMKDDVAIEKQLEKTAKQEVKNRY